jgi:hypothetical protein
MTMTTTTPRAPKAVISSQVMTFVRLVQDKIAETAKDDTDLSAGYRAGLTEALSLMLQATVDDHQKG